METYPIPGNFENVNMMNTDWFLRHLTTSLTNEMHFRHSAPHGIRQEVTISQLANVECTACKCSKSNLFAQGYTITAGSVSTGGWLFLHKRRGVRRFLFIHECTGCSCSAVRDLLLLDDAFSFFPRYTRRNGWENCKQAANVVGWLS